MPIRMGQTSILKVISPNVSDPKPRVEVDDKGAKFYFLGSHLHREDGPAIEWKDGTKAWFQNNLRHRLDGPACEYSHSKHWFQYGKCHRIDGPAIECTDGTKEWWFQGKEIFCDSQEEFEEQIKLAMFW
jgi:hypothetical protein